MARTKKSREMIFEAAREIEDRIDSLEDQSTQGNFVTHGRSNVLTAAIGRPEHSNCVCAARTGDTIRQYFGPTSKSYRTFMSITPEELEQLTQKIKD